MILKIGHRGASGYEPENTLKSFKKAISLGAEMVECDAHLSKDNQIVIIHDATVNRTTNGKGKISQLTLAEIKKLDAGKGEKIPILEEVINLIRGKCNLNIEVKEPEEATKIAKIIVKEKFVENTIVSSNNQETLLTIKTINPNIKTALVFYSTKTNWGQVLFDLLCLLFLPITKRIIIKKAKEAKVKTINLGKPLATRGMIKFLHKNGFLVNVWTVNKIKEIERFKIKGVDGIFSNYPDRV
jgi:glycerophosphoryl diester phosphodiesterase